MINEQFETPEFVELPTGDKTVYVSFEEAVSNPEICTQVTQTALAELDQWNQRYGAFFQRIDELAACQIVAAIHQAKQTMLRQSEAEGALEFDPDEYLA